MKTEEKLKQYIIEKYGSVYKFCKKFEIRQSTMGTLFTKNINKSTTEIIFKICTALNIDFYSLMKGEIKEQTLTGIALTQKEHNMINQYRALDSFGIKTVDYILNTEYERNKYYENEVEYLFKIRYDLPVAAGLGISLDADIENNLVKIPKSRDGDYSDFIIFIRGDSMEPTYYDGDNVLVKAQPAIDIGQVGIFVLNGDGYIKEMGLGKLISHNKKYTPIILHESDEIKCCGLVLGKTEVLE